MGGKDKDMAQIHYTTGEPARGTATCDRGGTTSAATINPRLIAYDVDRALRDLPVSAKQHGRAIAAADAGSYQPTGAEIRRHCAEIRKGWSASERKRRQDWPEPLSFHELSFLSIVCALNNS
jgi:hypothetical protein